MAWLAILVLLEASALAVGDDSVAAVQTSVRVQTKDSTKEKRSCSSSRTLHDVFVDWSSGVFGVPGPCTREQLEKEALSLAKERMPSVILDDSSGPRLDKWGRMAQALPVIVVVLLAASRLHIMFYSTAQVDVRKIAELLAALSLFLVSGPAVIILNKRIMKDYHFHFPIVLSSLGQLLMMIITRTSVSLGLVELQTKKMEWGRYLRVVLLMNVFNFGTQVLGMWSYMFVSVPEIQVLKSLSVVLVMVFAVILVKEPVNGLLVLSILIIAAGSAIAAVFENDTSRIANTAGAQVIGVILCILASAFEAAKSVCSQILMDSLKVFDGLYWSSPAFMAVAVIFVAAIEMKGLVHHHFTGELIGLLVLNAFLTGLIVASSFWFVKLVGALALKVVTQARTVGLILISVFFFHEECSSMTYIGYTVSLVGIGLFDYGKKRQQEQAAKGKQEPAAQPRESDLDKQLKTKG